MWDLSDGASGNSFREGRYGARPPLAGVLGEGKGEDFLKLVTLGPSEGMGELGEWELVASLWWEKLAWGLRLCSWWFWSKFLTLWWGSRLCSCDRERNDVERLGRGQWLRRWHLDIVMMIGYGFQKVFV